MNKFDRAMFVLPGMPKLAKTAMLGVAAVVISGCATTAQMPVAPMQADRVETLLDAHAERASKAWRELADLEQGMAQVVANRNAAMAGDLHQRVDDFVFSGELSDFVHFIAGNTGWNVKESEGKKKGSAIVHVRATSNTLQEVLHTAGSQVTHQADLVVTISDRSMRVRYKE